MRPLSRAASIGPPLAIPSAQCTIPAGFAPFGIQHIGGKAGALIFFGEDGMFVKRFAQGRPLNQPWGVALRDLRQPNRRHSGGTDFVCGPKPSLKFGWSTLYDGMGNPESSKVTVPGSLPNLDCQRTHVRSGPPESCQSLVINLQIGVNSLVALLPALEIQAPRTGFDTLKSFLP